MHNGLVVTSQALQTPLILLLTSPPQCLWRKMTEQVGISFIFVLAVLSVHCFSYMFQVIPYLLEIQKIT